MVRPRPALHRVETRVDVVPRGRAHGCSLEAARKPNALQGQPVDIWRLRLSAVATDVTKSAIICNNENQVRFFSHCLGWQQRSCKNQDWGNTDTHGIWNGLFRSIGTPLVATPIFSAVECFFFHFLNILLTKDFVFAFFKHLKHGVFRTFHPALKLGA